MAGKTPNANPGDELGDLNNGGSGDGGNTNKGGEKETPAKKETANSTDDLVKKLLERLDKQDAEIKALKETKQVSPTGDMAKFVSEIVNQIKKTENSGEFNRYKYFSPEELDPEDVLQEPVIFYAYSTGYVISDDLRNGKPVLTPHGNTIFFLFQATQKVKDGKGYNLQSYSTYPSYSKKEVKWLKEHRFYGVHFFETLKEAIETNSEIASRITKHLATLAGLQPQQIINIFKQNFPGEPMVKDVDKMKNRLAMEAVKKEILADSKAQDAFFNDVFKKNLETYTQIKG